MLKINEIFYSIQGESTYAGIPFAFIRLSGCPLRCTWCDTKYAYTEGENKSVDEIIDEIKKFNTKYVEITGGEPLAQKEIIGLINKLQENSYTVFLETSGAYDISNIATTVHRIIDVKCPSSGMTNKMVWKNFHQIGKNDEIKFVIANRKDFEFAEKIVLEYPQMTEVPLLISPVWGSVEIQDLADWILKSSISWRLQLQMHKIIWTNIERGV